MKIQFAHPLDMYSNKRWLCERLGTAKLQRLLHDLPSTCFIDFYNCSSPCSISQLFISSSELVDGYIMLITNAHICLLKTKVKKKAKR